MTDTWLTIGEVAERAGVAASALRFYEDEGLIDSERTDGGQRRYHREVMRRVAFIGSAQTVGLSLREIKAAMQTLPRGRTPTKADWERLSKSWQPLLDERIAELVRLRDQLTSCIGCGCLSLRSARCTTQVTVRRERGAGPRYLIGDRPTRSEP